MSASCRRPGMSHISWRTPEGPTFGPYRVGSAKLSFVQVRFLSSPLLLTVYGNKPLFSSGSPTLFWSFSERYGHTDCLIHNPCSALQLNTSKWHDETNETEYFCTPGVQQKVWGILRPGVGQAHPYFTF